MTPTNKKKLEKILNSKVSSYAGSLLMLPILLAVFLLGSLSYTVGNQSAPIIERILTPPKVQKKEEIKFEDMVPDNAEFQTSFEEFQQNEVALFTVPGAVETEEVPDIKPPQSHMKTEVELSEAPDESEAWEFEEPTVEVPGSALNDPMDKITNEKQTEELDASLRRTGGTGPTQSADQPGTEQPDGTMLGKDQSGDIKTDSSAGQVVVINRGQRQAGDGVGMSKPASKEKTDLTGWILGHPHSLPPAVAEALGYNRQKADRTSIGSVVDENGKLYQFFFLHRMQNNLLRILVVLGNQAYHIDLPDFYLEANHVKAGRVFRGQSPEDDPFAPGAVIEVALESVDEIPAEVPNMFQLVLDWLEIKGQE
jgi:hypothetical protein